MSLSERVGTDAPVRITSGDFAKRLTAKGIRFSMRNGVVKKLKPSEESKEADVLNIQRGLLSMFQVRGKNQIKRKGQRVLKRVEVDVSGTCATEYRFLGNDVVRKVKDLNTCKDHR